MKLPLPLCSVDRKFPLLFLSSTWTAVRGSAISRWKWLQLIWNYTEQYPLTTCWIWSFSLPDTLSAVSRYNRWMMSPIHQQRLELNPIYWCILLTILSWQFLWFYNDASRFVSGCWWTFHPHLLQQLDDVIVTIELWLLAYNRCIVFMPEF